MLSCAAWAETSLLHSWHRISKKCLIGKNITSNSIDKTGQTSKDQPKRFSFDWYPELAKENPRPKKTWTSPMIERQVERERDSVWHHNLRTKRQNCLISCLWASMMVVPLSKCLRAKRIQEMSGWWVRWGFRAAPVMFEANHYDY